MHPLTTLRSYWHRFCGMELQAGYTAIAFHWPTRFNGEHRPDVTFILRGLHRGEPLHRQIDALLEEHACTPADTPTDVLTEVTIFWHQLDGQWDSEEFVSHSVAT